MINRHFSKLAYFLAPLIAMIMACRHHPEEIKPDPPVPPPPVVNCDPDTIYFQNEILPLITSSCARSGCHDLTTQMKEVILTDYTHIIQTGEIRPGDPGESKLYEMITESDPQDRMPPLPNAPLSPEQIASVETWITQGALNNRCDSTGCDSVNVTYASVIRPLLDSRCAGCHSGAAPAGGLDLSDYNGAVAAATSGRLMGAVRWLSGYARMPQYGNQLSTCEIAQFQKWIDDGTPNN